MAEFIEPYPSLNIGTKGQWILEEPLYYRSDVAQQDITVPAGFVTDLASIPKIVPRWIVDVNEEHRFAAIVHDYLCRTWPVARRHVADRIFREAMKVLGVPGWKRYSMWLAVRSMTAWLQLTKRNGHE